MILLGPIGLAGGFFVKGDAPEIPPGTMLYLETSALADLKGYPVPPSLQELLENDPDGKDDPQPEYSAGSGEEGGGKVE